MRIKNGLDWEKQKTNEHERDYFWAATNKLNVGEEKNLNVNSLNNHFRILSYLHLTLLQLDFRQELGRGKCDSMSWNEIVKGEFCESVSIN